MTTEAVYRCKQCHRRLSEDMFVCDCRDPRVPFTVDENTVCPCYKKVTE